MKLFKTNDISTVKSCQRESNFNIPSDVFSLKLQKDLKLSEHLERRKNVRFLRRSSEVMSHYVSVRLSVRPSVQVP